MRQAQPLAVRFWERVAIGDDCWEWTGGRDRDGYGLINAVAGTQRRLMRAPRVSFMLKNGEVPLGMCVCHHCDNPGCVRPDHLFLGTQRDNIRDKVEKGRHLGNNQFATRTACSRQHTYTAANTRWCLRRGRRQRKCLECERIYRIASRQKETRIS